MHIRQNHWVLGVYDQERVLVYNSLPTVGTEDDVSSCLYDFFSKTLRIDTRDYPYIWFTSPLRQSNNSDCGVMCIVAGFCKALNIAVVPLQIDTAVWRDVLLRLLGPPDPPDVDKHRANPIDIPKLQPQASVSELPGVSSDWLRTVYRSLTSRSRTNQMAMDSAKLYLEICGSLTPTAYNSAALARFERVKEYYGNELQRLQAERE